MAEFLSGLRNAGDELDRLLAQQEEVPWARSRAFVQGIAWGARRSASVELVDGVRVVDPFRGVG